MAKRLVSAPGRNRRGCTEVAGILTLLLAFSSVSQGLDEEKTRLSSSQQRKWKEDVNVKISESLKNTRTLEHNLRREKRDGFSESTQNVILSTAMSTDSSYVGAVASKERANTERLDKDCQDKKELSTEQDEMQSSGAASRVESKNYYDAIKPTKTVRAEELKIAQTDIIRDGSGEGEGVSMSPSRPLKTLEVMSYKRSKRGFGDATEEQKRGSKAPGEDGKGKHNLGKNYNHIEQTLGKIAKITINDEREKPASPTAGPPANFRESREEENRKASPDIQDIITGIVNILNGKATKPGEGNTGRPPRPTSTRINNRGPPRISDVPPLDFDGPPPYRPLPPPSPPKRVPPPYPFDIPPSMPNIPLPPQPHKPGPGKLPPHPFIDGVPIPKIVIPDEQNKKPSDSNYDTISVSEPVDPQEVNPILTTNATRSPIPPAKNATAVNEKVKPPPDANPQNSTSIANNQTGPAASATIAKPVKVTGQKVSLSNGHGNKNGTKRVRPTPVTRPAEKPLQTNATLAVEEEHKAEEEETPQRKNETKAGGASTEATLKLPLREEIVNGTQKPGQVVEEPFRPSANVSAFLNLKPSLEAKQNKTETTVAPNTTPKVQGESTKHIGTYNGTEKYEIDLELPVLLEPSIGVGEATPVLESSVLELSMLPTEPSRTTTPVLSTQRPGQPTMSETSYKARPGIVLDDPEYKPGGHKRPVITSRPIITAPPPHSHYGEIFDVTVHAVQGPGEEPSSGKPFIVPVNIDGVQVQNPQIVKGDVSVITKPEEGQNFVSIDGKRTYINLFGEVSSTKINPTTTQPPITGTGYAIPHKESPVHQPGGSRPPASTSPPRRPPYKRPSHPPVRIDTCIVGDDTTCDSAQNEMCRTEDGVSSCHCRPGYNRRKHRDTCRRVVSMLTSLRVDRLYDRKVKWQDNLRDPDSEEYRQLSYEASQAIESAMSMTPFSDDFINSRINSIYAAKNLENDQPAVYVNVTIQLEENLDTVRPAVKHDIQRHLLRVIQRRNNNVGNSAVWVDGPPGSILALQDVDECSSADLHDCHERAICQNTFGSFRCQCPTGSRDPWVGNIHREGRFCETCSPEFCNNRGECSFEHGQQVCHCSGSFYGTQCEIDGEVLGVAIGASVAAAIIIVLTLICLCMWSRRWSREQKSAVGAGMGSPVFGYMATGPTVKTPSVGGPPYQVSIEDRIRWAQIADVMAKSNHYAQPEPVNTATRTSFGGYPTLPSHTLSMAGTLPLPAIAPPVPLPRLTLTNKQPMGTYGAHSQIGSIQPSNHGMRSSLETTSSSEEEDRADLLGRNFNVPRPKSRTSVANQSGIYYDVDFDRSDAYSKQNTIPMSTYTLNPQHQVRPYFR